MPLPKILVLTPARNEDHSLEFYFEALRNLDYPKDLIDLYWLENDSSDNTLEMLKTARPNMLSDGFNSVDLKINGLMVEFKDKYGFIGSDGKVAKVSARYADGGPSYQKDISYGFLRVHSWKKIWHNYFFPLIKKSDVDYVMPWWADAVPPANVIHEYLKVFKEYKDAGWVGGGMYRRYPHIELPLSPLCSGMHLQSPKQRNILFYSKPVKVILTGHVWMMPREAVSKCEFYQTGGSDMHQSIISGLVKQGLRVYYQPSVFLKHVSNDGVIYPSPPPKRYLSMPEK